MDIYFDEQRGVLSRTTARFRIENILEIKQACERNGGELELNIMDNGVMLITRLR